MWGGVGESGRQAHAELLAQHLRGFFPGGRDPDCRKVHGLQTCVTARVDPTVGLQVHVHVQCHTVVGAVAAHLDAQRSDLAQPDHSGAMQVTLHQRKRLIAAQLGIAPETFSRVLRHLRELGLIHGTGNVLALPQPRALQSMAGC